eukprot:GSMAST32.ASY1.ANO1.1146.1 assembled CDS
MYVLFFSIFCLNFFFRTKFLFARYGVISTVEANDLGLRSSNLWVLPVDKNFKYGGPGTRGYALNDSDINDIDNRWPEKKEDENQNVDGDDDDMLLFVGFPSCKDPSCTFSKLKFFFIFFFLKISYPGKQACEMISCAHSKWFDQFINEEEPNKEISGKRKNTDYTALKERLKQRFIQCLYRYCRLTLTLIIEISFFFFFFFFFFVKIFFPKKKKKKKKKKKIEICIQHIVWSSNQK